MFDSHTHFLHRKYQEEPTQTPADIFQQAEKAGLTGMMGIATTPAEWQPYRTAIQQAQTKLRLCMAAGLHPNHAHEESVTQAQLESLTEWPQVAALGECGLDYYYGKDASTQKQQRESFITHCQAAQTTGLPLVIHTRDAEADTIAILSAHNVRFVLHCFTGTESLARWAIEETQGRGYISFSGILTFKKSHELRTIAAAVPPTHTLIETDAPYLAPEPHRSARNTPALMVHTAQVLGQIRHTTFAQIITQTTTAFHTFAPRAML